MNVVKCENLKHINNEIIIYLIADVHVGSEECNITKFKEVIDEVVGIENAYVVLNGDLIDNALKDSVSFEYSGLTPSASINSVCSILKPIANKILCINTGNHEFRTKKVADIDPNMLIANALGIKDRYSDGSSIIFVKLSAPNRKTNVLFTILCYHGAGGGGSKAGGKANKVQDMSKICQADIYMMSHVHLPMTFKEDYIDIDKNKLSIRQKTRTYVISNSFLNYGGYGERKGYTPTAIAVPKVHLTFNRVFRNGKDHIDKNVFVEV